MVAQSVARGQRGGVATASREQVLARDAEAIVTVDQGRE